MKIEILYVEECPSHAAAVKLVREVLESYGLAVGIDEVLVADERMASELRFSGSPTIRINGRDVLETRGESKGFALSCRLYPGAGEVGLPLADTVRRAVIEARQGE